MTSVIITLVVFAAFIATFLAYFYRDPVRKIPQGKVVVSPADGKVISVSKDKVWDKIVIFMNLHNVHVQRVPYEGKVVSIKRVDGKNLPAYEADAAHNKQVITTIKTSFGNILVKQATGLFVRRISTFIYAGEFVKRGERLGRIAFGSRVELWLPAKRTTLVVAEGTNIFAGETVVAKL